MMMPRSVRLALLAIVPILLSGCASNSPPEAIVGVWQSGMNEKKNTMTFSDTGRWTFVAGKKKQKGTYKFVADKQIEINVDVPSEAKPIVYKRTLFFAHHDKMTTTDVDTGSHVTWKRTEEE